MNHLLCLQGYGGYGGYHGYSAKKIFLSGPNHTFIRVRPPGTTGYAGY